MGGHVECRLDGGIAEVTLCHPGKFNAMSRAMWRELKSCWEGLRAEVSVRAVLLHGADGHFCAGGDIAEYPGFRHDPVALAQFHEEDVWGALKAIADSEWPVMAAIEGHCMGAGMEMACASDLRVAGHGSRFGAPIARLGFPMAPREAALVAGAAGLSTAREMLLGASTLHATVLHHRGFIHRVVDDGQAVAAAREWLRQMVQTSPLAARLNKQTLRALAGGATPDELVPTAYDYAEHPEHREGIAAFLDKRKPLFGKVNPTEFSAREC